ncbi:MAG: glycine cleavage system aminomethyltransferase GcvT [Chromatiaceae bacterium]|nr:glycine cleavage system aminomethyltransferase GcvT [Gammaproteobacteria bacterium]MCB1881742.1 glycine cleavage system aminomethyltransferase GcvT [Gammaproteobacteria bacterium]MCP5447350.1 glycine cleavage system aminomethyltransferase GcvT [Chromatiaceae bacterium]
MSEFAPPVKERLLRTPLYDLHLELGGKMVPFAGYEMPVHYPSGILKEHQQTRNLAGLFDVSHMGQVKLSGSRAAAAMEGIVPVDVIDLAVNCQRYALFTNDDGGILDDLMITNAGGHLFVVVNAACKEQDIAHMRRHLSGDCDIEPLNDRALLALQGPAAGEVMASLAPESRRLVFMTAARLSLAGADCFVTRSGYTGEDGFEISVAADRAEAVARELLAYEQVAPVGLGARDSLRLEAGLCLYGHDIDGSTTPVEASLLWAIQKVRRAGGAREAGFPGADVILEQIATGVSRRRVGIRPQSKLPVREGSELLDSAGNRVGTVTSGGFGPTVGAPVAMGYVDIAHSKLDTGLQAIVRGKPHPVRVAKTPFVEQHYYRG